MKKLLFPTAIALLLVLTSCEIYVERILNSGDGEEESTSSSSRRTNTSSSREEDTGDEITADEAEEFLNAIDEEEALAWFQGLSTYEVYWDDGESSIFYQVDRNPEDLYMFNEQKGSDYHLYNLIYDVFHGELTEYHTYTFNALSLDEDSYTDVYTEEQVANTFASFEEDIIESYRYSTFFAYALPFDFGLLPDVAYSFEEENLKIAAEFEGLAIEEEIYSGTFEVLINPYGYFLEGFSYIEAEDGTAYETEAYFIPDAEFERHTAAEVYAMAKGETEDEEEDVEEEIDIDEAGEYLNGVNEEEAAAWFEAISTYEFYIGNGETHTFYQIDGSVEDDLYMYMETEILSTSDTGTLAVPTETFYEADGEGGYSAYLLVSLDFLTVARKVTDLSADEMKSLLAGLKATASGLYDYDSFAESYLPFSFDELEDVTYSLVGGNLRMLGELDDFDVYDAEVGENYVYTGYQEVLVNPYGYVLDATIDITSVGESDYYRRAYFTPEAEFERYSTENLNVIG